MTYQTSDFDTLTIPKLIDFLLDQFGVKWQGKKNKRAPIVDLICSLDSQELEVQSESDFSPTEESAQPPLSVDKVLNTSMNELSQKTLSELREYRDTCCSLDDNPNPYQYKLGDLVELKPKEEKVWVHPLCNSYLERYEVAVVIAIKGNVLILGLDKHGTNEYVQVNVASNLVDRVFCPLIGSQVKLRPHINPAEGSEITHNDICKVVGVTESPIVRLTVQAEIGSYTITLEAPVTHFMSAALG